MAHRAGAGARLYCARSRDYPVSSHKTRLYRRLNPHVLCEHGRIGRASRLGDRPDRRRQWISAYTAAYHPDGHDSNAGGWNKPCVWIHNETVWNVEFSERRSGANGSRKDTCNWRSPRGAGWGICNSLSRVEESTFPGHVPFARNWLHSGRCFLAHAPEVGPLQISSWHRAPDHVCWSKVSRAAFVHRFSNWGDGFYYFYRQRGPRGGSVGDSLPHRLRLTGWYERGDRNDSDRRLKSSLRCDGKYQLADGRAATLWVPSCDSFCQSTPSAPP